MNLFIHYYYWISFNKIIDLTLGGKEIDKSTYEVL